MNRRILEYRNLKKPDESGNYDCSCLIYEAILCWGSNRIGLTIWSPRFEVSARRDESSVPSAAHNRRATPQWPKDGTPRRAGSLLGCDCVAHRLRSPLTTRHSSLLVSLQNHLRQIVNPILLLPLLIILLFRAGVFAETLTLEESISEALENNPSIRVARAKIREAEAEKGKALSNFFPRVYASSFYTRLDEEREIDFSSFAESIPLSSDEIYGYSLGLTQSLFTGGRITSLYRMQTENLEASEKQFEKVRNDLIFEVKESYFRVLESEKLRKVAKEAAGQVGAHLEVIENFFREGMVPEVDVLRSKVTLANAKQNLINAENGVRLSRSHFNSLLNRDMGSEVSLEDILSFEDVDFDLPSLIGEAFANRPEMQELENRLKMAEQGVRIARSDFFPQVAFVGSWDNRKGEEVPVDEWEQSWNATVQVSVDIWDWGENRNEHRRAKAELTQLESRFLLLKNGIELEVRRAYLVLLAARDKIKVQEEAVKSAEKNSRDTSLRFKEGVATNTDVLDAQTMFSQSRTDYYRALYGYNLALAALERAVGKGSGQ